MSNEALYRKYRPQSFKDVIGQEDVVTALTGALAKKSVSHAYLFAGSRGTGTTSRARIFCRELDVHDDDVYEIDAASNRGIDDVRALRDAVSVLPMHSKRKAYIIDEVHMLTKEAFNALLKTLEEPPSHVIFILATTDPDKLPETIVSRCQTFIFKKPGVSVIREVVVRSAEKEGIILDLGASELIALVADGSFRDAYGVLQKVISAIPGKSITSADVERVTGAPRRTLVHDFVVAIAHRNAAHALGVIRDVEKSNADMRLFTELVIERTRSVLYARIAPEVWKKTVVGMSVDDRKAIDVLAKDTEAVITSGTLSALLGAYSEIGRSVIPAVPLEIAILALVKE